MSSVMMQNLSFYTLVVLLYAAFCLAQELSVRLDQRGLVGKDEGESLEISCEVQNLGGEYVAWLHNTQITAATNPGKYHLTANATAGEFTLTISNLTRITDGGIYSCAVYASEELTTALATASLEVVVFYFPDAIYPECNPASQVVIITEDMPVTFRCESIPGERPVVLAWSLDDGTIIQAEDGITTGEADGKKYAEYTFTPTIQDVGMTATCTISNSAIFPGRTSLCTIGPLQVQYHPRDIAITNQTFSYGNSTYDAISCNASAFPPSISYTWSFNTPLDSSEHMLTDDNQTLVILNLTMCDSPVIATCLATNDIGNTSANFTLCEPPAPPNPVCYPEKRVIFTEGIPEMFQCVSRPGENPIEVEWSRDLGQISQGNVTKGDLPNDYRYTNYTFVPTRDDFGDYYTCTLLVNDATITDSCTIGPLIILYSPSDVTISNQTYSVGNLTYDAVLCSASAFPSNISYSWSFNIPLDSSKYMVIDNDKTLVILNITTCESPIIATCLATNDIGNQAVNFTLCEPPPPQPPTQLPTMSDLSPTTPQAGTLTLTLYIVIIGGGIIVLTLIIGLCCIALTKFTGDSGKMDQMEKDDEIAQHKSVRVQLKRDSRIRDLLRSSILYTEEDIPEEDTAMDNLGFDKMAMNHNVSENNALSEYYESDMYPLMESVEEINLHKLDEEDMAKTQDSSNNTDFDDVHKHGASVRDEVEDKDDDDEHQGNDKDEKAKEEEKDSQEAEVSQGDVKRKESSDHKNPASFPDDENKDKGNHGDDNDNDVINDDDIKDDEKMVDPVDVELEAELNMDDPRESMVQEALLAVQVSDMDGDAKGGRKSEMQL